MAKLSIIIPVYQVETTLDRCIESIIRQSFSDYELLLIDDGSTDRSGKICDEWQTKDERIRVVHQVNGGLSNARNTGLSQAQGNYITFVDSDDTIANGTLQHLMRATEQYPTCNIIEYPVWVHYSSPQERLLTLENRVFKDVRDYWVNHQGYLHAYSCNKIYRRDLFEKIRFPDGKIFEDVITTARLLNESGNIATISHGLYYYYSNPKGLTNTTHRKGLNDLLQWHCAVIRDIFPFHQTLNISESLYYMHIVNIQLDVYSGDATDIVLPHYEVAPQLLFDKNTTFSVKLKLIIIIMLKIKCLCKIKYIARKLNHR